MWLTIQVNNGFDYDQSWNNFELSMRGQGEESEREKQIGEKVEREGGSEKRLFHLLSTLRGRRSMKKKGKKC